MRGLKRYLRAPKAFKTISYSYLSGRVIAAYVAMTSAILLHHTPSSSESLCSDSSFHHWLTETLHVGTGSLQNHIEHVKNLKVLALYNSIFFTVLFLMSLMVVIGILFYKKTNSRGLTFASLLIICLSLGAGISVGYNHTQNLTLQASQNFIHPEVPNFPQEDKLMFEYSQLIFEKIQMEQAKSIYRKNDLTLIPFKTKWYLFGWDQLSLVSYELEVARHLFEDQNRVSSLAHSMSKKLKEQCQNL